ncbi:hypothetical protein B0H63DRAFT_505451 [Podospora didyma]|uniref:Uncharacterized protein n=1 Tax=Podospora didyma TaxID=330526 RepID=A0AAE0P5C1_9PEZI|nr:hypothetical protein B0H63DRAFT_505451 [Podospora didyma]
MRKTTSQSCDGRHSRLLLLAARTYYHGKGSQFRALARLAAADSKQAFGSNRSGASPYYRRASQVGHDWTRPLSQPTGHPSGPLTNNWQVQAPLVGGQLALSAVGNLHGGGTYQPLGTITTDTKDIHRGREAADKFQEGLLKIACIAVDLKKESAVLFYEGCDDAKQLHESEPSHFRTALPNFNVLNSSTMVVVCQTMAPTTK